MKKRVISILITSLLFAGSLLPKGVLAADLVTNYKVTAGDTLWKISKTFNVSIDNMKKWNQLNTDTIYVGQVLKVAPVHVVQSGDTLWIIANKYSVTVDYLIKLNNLTSTKIIIGQTLKIGETGVQAPQPVPQPIPQPAPEQIPQVQPQPASSDVKTINYKVLAGDNLWTIAKNNNTSVDAIMKSNMLVVDYLMPNQILTIPINSTEVVKPVGITMMKARVSDSFGDIYTWENAMRLWTVGTTGVIRDIQTDKTFNIRYYGGSNHSDIVPLNQQDTDVMKSIYGTWSWDNAHKRPMVLYFTKGGVNYQMAVSLTGMPHSTTDSTTNGMDGHCDLYFYNSVGHSDPVIDPVHQANILKANGQ